MRDIGGVEGFRLGKTRQSIANVAIRSIRGTPKWDILLVALA